MHTDVPQYSKYSYSMLKTGRFMIVRLYYWKSTTETSRLVSLAVPTWSFTLPFCLLCGVDLPDSKKRRSALSDAGANVKKVIKDFSQKKLCNDSSLIVWFQCILTSTQYCVRTVVTFLIALCFRDLNNKLEVDFQKSLDTFLLDYSDSVSDSVVSVDVTRSSSLDSSFNTPR